MSKSGLLADDLLRELYDAALSAGLERDALLAGVDQRLTAGLHKASSPGAQIWKDLAALNDIPELADGSVPLRSWLEAAKHLAKPRAEAATFQKALLLLPGGSVVAASSGPRPSAPVPAPTAPRTQESSASAEAPRRTDVVILTALKEEYDEARRVELGAIDNWSVDKDITGFEIAFRTYSTSDGGSLRIALTWATRMRTTAAADTAARLVDKLGARCVAMSGVCAGRRGKVQPGDVILGSLLYTYDTGALRAELDSSGARHERFQAEPNPYPLDDQWLHRALAFQPAADAPWIAERPPTLAAQCDWVLARLRAGEDPLTHADKTRRCPSWTSAVMRLRLLALVTERSPLALTEEGISHIDDVVLLHGGGLPEPPEFRVHVAPIATGNNVMRDPQLFERLSDSMRTVLGVEMEAAAIAAIAHARTLKWVVMKGVMDHADHDKDDQVKPFAARAAAECLIAFLRENLPANDRPPANPTWARR